MQKSYGQIEILLSIIGMYLLFSFSVASAEVIWKGDFETGKTDQWRGVPKPGSFKVVKSPVRAGKYSLRIDGTNAARRGKNDRIEFQHQPKQNSIAEGTERYFSWSVLVPKKLTKGVHTVGYFEARNSWKRLMAFEVRGEDVVYNTRVPYKQHWIGKGKFTAGDWHDFIVHVRWSRHADMGFIEVWFDGEKVVPLTKTATLLDQNEAFLQVGFMRATSDIPETIIIDHVIEATTLEDVMLPGAK